MEGKMQHANDNHTGLRFLSVCSGIEAASVAWHPLGWQCIGVAEIEPFPAFVLAHHYVALPAKYHPQHKPTCTEPAISIGAVECANGATQHKAYCINCRRKGGAIAHDALVNFDLSCVEVISSHNQAICERCGSIGAEVHHWAPRHLFDDSYEWPTSNLCKSCHTLWHRVVTPKMSATRRAA